MISLPYHSQQVVDDVDDNARPNIGLLASYPAAVRSYRLREDPPFSNFFPLPIVVDDAKPSLTSGIGRSRKGILMDSKMVGNSASSLDIKVG